MIAREDLDIATLFPAKEGEVLDDIEQACLVTDAANERFERDDALLALVVDLLPLEIIFPAGGQAADLALCAIGDDDGGVIPEQLWDGVFVVADVAVEGVLKMAIVGF